MIVSRSQPQGTACQAMIDNRCCWTRGKVLGGSSVMLNANIPKKKIFLKQNDLYPFRC